jgi:hypothetical protein
VNLSEILQNEQQEHRKELSELKFLEMLRERARNAHSVMKQSPIFKEDKGSDFMLVTPADKDTRSAFWVDKLIKDLTSWSRYPSRSRFIKGYTSIERVGGTEDAQYVVIPLDRARIGVCPTASFYRSFKKAEEGMGLSRVDNDGLSTWIETATKAISEIYPEAKLDVRTPATFADFKKMMKEVDREINANQAKLKKLLKSAEDLSDAEKLVLTDLLARHVTSCEAYLAEKLDPESNGFGNVRIESLSAAPDDREVWISDPCLLIRRSKYIEMHEKGSIK